MLSVSESHTHTFQSTLLMPAFHIIGISIVCQTKWQKFNFINKYTFRLGFGAHTIFKYESHMSDHVVWILETPPSYYANLCYFFCCSYRLIYIPKHLKPHQQCSIATLWNKFLGIFQTSEFFNRLSLCFSFFCAWLSGQIL